MTDLKLENWGRGRVGFVAIVGRPNVGKSTFINRILNYHLTAVSGKPQTTRRNWRGIYADDDCQVIFTDTPGIHQGRSKLSNSMTQSIKQSLKGTDLILCMCDPTRRCGNEDELVAARLSSFSRNTILVLNKSDLSTKEQRERAVEFYSCHLGGKRDVIEISAIAGDNVDRLLGRIKARMPEGPFLYPQDQLTDALERDIGAEIIREAALNYLHDELPHATAVEILEWRELPKKVKISANFHVEKASHKPIVVGKNGDMLNRIRRDAVTCLRDLTDGFVELKLFVKVSPDWFNNTRFLRSVGLK